MDKHDFTEFYTICGPVMQAEIEKLKIEVNREHTAYKQHNYLIYEHVADMENCLKLLNDDEFELLYLNMPQNAVEYTANDDKYNNQLKYQAIMSNTELVKKCISISMTRLNNLINLFEEHLYTCAYTSTNFIDSCKLMMPFVNKLHLLTVSWYFHDYASIKYVVDNASSQDILNILEKYSWTLTHPTIKILLIDRVHRDESLNLNCIDILFNTFKHEIKQENLVVWNYIITICYHIIKNSLSIKDNEAFINKYTAESDKIFHTALTEYYFKPRGSHTKSAIHY
jgi:uncharacterized membrane protein